MKVLVSTAKTFYCDLEEIAKLEELGFDFSVTNKDNMFKLEDSIEINIENLDELSELLFKFGSIILDYTGDEGVKLTIYDGSVEEE